MVSSNLRSPSLNGVHPQFAGALPLSGVPFGLRQICRSLLPEQRQPTLEVLADAILERQPVAVPQTPMAASITATLPIASLREKSQTERTLASPSL